MRSMLLALALVIAPPQKAGEEAPVEKRPFYLSSHFWTPGAPISLRWSAPERTGGKLAAHPMVFQEGKLLGSVSDKEVAIRDDMAEFSLDSVMKKAVPGIVQVFLEKPGSYKYGPANLHILKEAPKADYDKLPVEQLEKMRAMLITTQGTMFFEFYPKKAPNTVRNFLKLSAKGFYDGTPFHRVVKDFMIQGGDPTGTGSGDPGYMIKAEFNDTKHSKGVISMARSQDPDSAGCQFFIVHGDHASHLDGQYTAFGKLLDGFDTLDRIASAPVGMNDGGEESKPLAPVVLKKVILVERPSAPAPAEPKKP